MRRTLVALLGLAVVSGLSACGSVSMEHGGGELPGAPNYVDPEAAYHMPIRPIRHEWREPGTSNSNR